MSSSIESHAHTNGVVPTLDVAQKDRSERMLRALYAGASAGLRTFTVPSTALRVKDNAWAPLFASLARAEIIYDKLPETPTRLSVRGLAFRAIAAGSVGAAIATRKAPAWLPLSGIAIAAAMATAYVGATLRIRAADAEIPDLILSAIEDQIATAWADRAFKAIEIPREPAPAVKTVSLL